MNYGIVDGQRCASTKAPLRNAAMLPTSMAYGPTIHLCSTPMPVVETALDSALSTARHFDRMPRITDRGMSENNHNDT